MRECEILGFKAYDEKDENKKLTGNKMIRVVIAVDPRKEGYYGKAPAVGFIKYDIELEGQLKAYIDDSSDELKAYYTTTDDIISGKTKIENIIIKA